MDKLTLEVLESYSINKLQKQSKGTELSQTECSDEEIDRFYDELEEAMNISKYQDITVVIGFFNAEVGSERHNNIVGSHGLETKNERGRLTDRIGSNE